MRRARVLGSLGAVIGRAVWLRLYRPEAFRQFVVDMRDLNLEWERERQRHARRDQGEMRHNGDTAEPSEWGKANLG